MDPLAHRVARRFAHVTMPLEPVVHGKPPNVLHTFQNDEDGMVSYVFPSQKPGKFNVQLRSIDEGEARVVSNHHDYPNEAVAVAAARKMVGEPHREVR